MSQHIHIIGICGTFMGGIAVIAREMGFQVSGSDQNVYPPMSDTLAAHGVEILTGFSADHIKPRPDLVIVGNICSRGNPELEAVLDENIAYTSGPQWLAETVLSKRHVLAVSGTHGKTSVTSMLTWILTEAGLNPGYLIGGVAQNFSRTAALGKSPYFVIEADEYDSAFFDKRPKFLHYRPRTLIINNIEFDHGDIYRDLDAIKLQFQYLLRTVPATGLVIHPENDTDIEDVIAKGIWAESQTIAAETSPWQVKLLQPDASQFEVFYQAKSCGVVRWKMLGQHNVENALAAIAAAVHVGVKAERAVEALCCFSGVKRRMEFVGEVNGVSIYDDFAHHPTAIKRTLQALHQKASGKPIVAILQFGSNTMRSGGHKTEEVASSLAAADKVVLLDDQAENTYIAALRRHLPMPVQVCKSVDEIVTSMGHTLKPQDQVLIMSNKGFGGLAARLLVCIPNPV